MPGSFSTVIAHMEPPSSRKQAKRVRLGPERPLLGPWRSSEGPGEADLIPTTPDWPAWVGFMVTTHFDLVSGPFWTTGGSKRACFGPNAPFEDLGGSRRASGDQIWSLMPPIVLPGFNSWSPHTLVWYRVLSGQSGPNLALWGPPRSPTAPFMAKTGPFCLFSQAGWFFMGYNCAG